MDLYNDQDSVEWLKNWWRQNWKAIVGGVAGGLLIVGGWQGWQSHRTQQADVAAVEYGKLRQLLDKEDVARADQLTQKILDEYGNTVQADQAALTLASYHIQHERTQDSVKLLRWVAEQGSDPYLRGLAKLRLARVLSFQNQTQNALQVLDKQEKGYEFAFLSLQGQIHADLGQKDAARVSYTEALKYLNRSDSEQAKRAEMIEERLGRL